VPALEQEKNMYHTAVMWQYNISVNELLTPAVVSCLERNFETIKQSKTPFLLLLSSSTGTSLYFYLDGIWAAPHGSEFNPVPCHFVFLA
jgi:hypothetical protein